MKLWAPIRYGEFYDVPRIFLVTREHVTYLFDCKFDEAKGDYCDIYEVFVVPFPQENEITKGLGQLRTTTTKSLGNIKVTDVEFDPTHRSQVNLDIFTKLGV